MWYIDQKRLCYIKDHLIPYGGESHLYQMPNFRQDSNYREYFQFRFGNNRNNFISLNFLALVNLYHEKNKPFCSTLLKDRFLQMFSRGTDLESLSKILTRQK